MEFIITLAMKFWQWTILIAVVIIGWLINILDKRRENKLKFSNPLTTVLVMPTIGHRVIVRIRDEHPLTPNITNTDPAYSRVDGMGVAKAVGDFLKIERCLPLDETDTAKLSADLVNEFTEKFKKNEFSNNIIT